MPLKREYPDAAFRTDRNAVSPSVTSDEAALLSEIDSLLAAKKAYIHFTAAITRRFEADTTKPRLRELDRANFLGVLFSQFFIISGFIVIPEYAWLNLYVRLSLLVIGPCMSFFARSWSSKTLETALAITLFGMTCLPINLWYLSQAPYSLMLVPEILLCILFANTSVALRFYWACAVSLSVMAVMTACVLAKPGLLPALGATILLNIATAITYSLVANYRIECGARRAYLWTLRETLRARSLEAYSDTLLHLSETDELTGVSNRRALADQAPALNRAIAAGTPVAVILTDVDFFKLFNDRYGHAAGDLCLQQVASALAAGIPSGDSLLVRYGGEEFLIVLRGAQALDAVALAARLRKGIAALGIAHDARSDHLGVVSISAGIAISVHPGTKTIDDLVLDADRALYEAKSRGRNCAALAREAVTTAVAPPAMPSAA